MNPSDAFDRIVAALHQAMLDDSLWPAASALIDDALAAGSNTLGVSEGAGDDTRVHFAGFYRRGQRRPDLERQYFDHYHALDERVPRIRALPAGRLIHVPDLYTRSELRSSVAYNEGLRLLGVQNGMGVRLDTPGGLRIFWALGDPVAADGWPSHRLRLVERLLPHIRQFVLVRHSLAAADALGAGLERLLDNGSIGVMHLDRAGRLLAANALATDILNRADALHDSRGHLGAWLPADHQRLQRLLARALPPLGGAAPAAGSMTLGRMARRHRLALHVTPVATAGTDFGGRRVAALVLLVDPARRPRIEPAAVAATLGLSPAEGRIAALLAEGRSVRELVAATGLRESYVRWLLKATYKKLGVPGQAALVRLVLAADALPRP